VNNYILIKTDNENATFLIKDEEGGYYEIFRFSNISDEVVNENKTLVKAINQQEALKKFRIDFPNLAKRASKEYHETDLLL
jgi:hypothetical protein